jgi:2-methylcitrate dehydratase PrpD
MRIGEQIAKFVSAFPAREIPEGVVERAKAAIMDCIGVALAGLHEECSLMVRRVVESMGGSPQATLWGTGERTSVALAALANGTAAHALDFDDTNPVMLAHPSVQLVPGLWALGEFRHRSGRDILTAYVIGFEVGATLGRALNPHHVANGWLPVGTLGPLMQAAACARLFELTPRQTQMAIGIAANLASGLRCNSGTMAKPLLAGHASWGGTLAAMLALEGVTANPNALEDRFGYFENFGRYDALVLERAINSLGDLWQIVESGISFKLYPCCAGAHVLIDCALDIAQRHSPHPDQIESIDIRAPAGLRIALRCTRPQTVLEARFSLEYCVSRAILDRQMGVAQFCEQKIQDSGVRRLMERVRPTFYDGAAMKGGARVDSLPVEIRVNLKDGSKLLAHGEYAKGTRQNSISQEELEGKFGHCCWGKLSAPRIVEVVQRLRNLDQVEDMAELTLLFN